MSKKSAKLSLVGKEDSARLSSDLIDQIRIVDGLDFSSLDELSGSEAKRVERMIEALCPKAGIIAVARTKRTWDVRPVLIISEENGPSIVRSAGPEVSSVVGLSSKLCETFERLSRFADISSHMLAWGIWEDQVWCRRSLVSKTFSQVLSGETELTHLDFIKIIGHIVDELYNWHSRGIVHGHVVSSNIVVEEGGSVTFLDAGMGVALAKASKEFSSYAVQSYAPEIISGDGYGYPADIYGIGHIIRRVGLVIRKKYQFSEQRLEIESIIEPYLRLTSRMLESAPAKRPQIGELASLFRSFGEQTKKQTVSSSTSSEVLQGRIVHLGSSEASPVKTEEEKKIIVNPNDTKKAEEQFVFKDDFSTAPSQVAFHDKHQSLFAENALIFADEQNESGFEWHKEERDDSKPLVEGAKTKNVSVEQSNEEKHKTTQLGSKKTSDTLFWFLFSFCCVIVGYWLYANRVQDRYEDSYHSIEEMRFAWNSKIPSRMLPIALLAIDKESPNTLAQDVIVESVNSGQPLPKIVDVGLIRVAFSSKWEVELSPSDRRMALILGLSELLGSKAPRDIGSLENRHPALILALSSTAGAKVNSLFLSKIPAEVLTHLQVPYGPAFLKLIEGENNISCADENVQILARLGTRGMEEKNEIPKYLNSNPSKHLQALAILFSGDDANSKLLISLLLEHPNMNISIPEIIWAKEWELSKWSELEAGEQLYILAGIPPSTKLGLENIGKMFKHPSAAIRRYAILQAIDRIKFSHPGAFDLMTMVSKSPDLLTPEQLFKLAELLENPSKTTEERMKAWFALEPPVSIELIAPLLVKTASQSESTKFDLWLAVYLKSRGWSPDVSALKKLSLHPDRYTRLFAYDEIFKMKDEQSALIMLKSALEKEQDQGNTTQLKEMINKLRK